MSYDIDGGSRLTQQPEYSGIVIFSDELKFAMKEFTHHYSGPLPIRIADYAQSPISDLLAMSSARELVVSNSTFSWWSAWLGGQNSDLNVVVPSPWFAIESAAKEQLFSPNCETINWDLA
jgi:hypothetical protein